MVGVEPSICDSGVRNSNPNTANTQPVKKAIKKPVAAIFSALATSRAPRRREI